MITLAATGQSPTFTYAGVFRGTTDATGGSPPSPSRDPQGYPAIRRHRQSYGPKPQDLASLLLLGRKCGDWPVVKPHPPTNRRRPNSPTVVTDHRGALAGHADRGNPGGSAALAGSASPSSGWRFEKADQLADGVVAVLGMAKWELVVDFVLIAASLAGLRQVAGALEILDQLSGRSFRDAYGLCNVSEACTGIGREAYEHVRVVGDKGPRMFVITGNALHES